MKLLFHYSEKQIEFLIMIFITLILSHYFLVGQVGRVGRNRWNHYEH